MKLLLDQGLPRSACARLREFGHEVVHVGDVGMARALDADILMLAKSTGATIITLDADFHALLVRGSSSLPSVVRLRVQGLGSERLCLLIQSVIETCGEALATGAAVSADEDSARVRKLPIG
jgi:predicted nuclease of predicted toxin-antitoxin system